MIIQDDEWSELMHGDRCTRRTRTFALWCLEEEVTEEGIMVMCEDKDISVMSEEDGG